MWREGTEMDDGGRTWPLGIKPPDKIAKRRPLNLFDFEQAKRAIQAPSENPNRP
jgi:hypothetical protein